MLGLPMISSPASRPSLEGTKRFATARTRLTPRAPAFGNTSLNQEPGDWPHAPLFSIANKKQKMEEERRDEWLRPLFASTFIGGTGRGAAPSIGGHHPPSPIQNDRALALTLSSATRLRYLPHAMHAAYVAKDKGALWEE